MIDFRHYAQIDWESDAITLPDMFRDEPMLTYELIQTETGWIAFHFNERMVWVQVNNEELETYLCKPEYLRLHDKPLYESYDRSRRMAKRLQKMQEKTKLTKRIKTNKIQ